MPTLFLAPTAEEARRAAWEFLNQARPASTGLAALLDPPLIFTAAHSAASWRELAREAAESDGRTTFAPRLIRAEAFFARFHASLARRRALSGADRLWVLQSAARRAVNLAAGADFEAELSRIATRRDSLQLAARHIAALRRADLARFPNGSGAEALNALLQSHNARLESLGAFDFEAAPALFPPAAAKNRAFAWPRELLVDDETEISPALQIGLEALLEHADCVAATLVGHTEENPALAGALGWWQARGAEVVRVGDWKARGARVASRILGRDDLVIEPAGISSSGAPNERSKHSSEATTEAPSNLFLTPAHTPRDEMERIAARIRAGVEAGARPDDFVLGCADFGAYEADARYAFAAFGVPLDWPESSPLSHSPLVRALLGALDGAAQPLNVHALHNLFGDGTLRWNYEEKVLDARRLRAAALIARHVELDDLDAARAAFERKRVGFVREARHDDAQARTGLETCLAAGDLELVAAFGELRAPLCQPATAGVWHARVLEIAGRLAAHWLESESAAGARAQSDLSRFFCAAENVAERARGWDDAEEETPRSASEWMGWLRAEIEAGTDCDDPNARGGVRVAGIDAGVRGARATFWCGLSEGIWPRPSSTNAATRDSERILSAHRAAPLARATHHLARAAGEHAALYLSHARHLEGRETPPSPLLDDLGAAFPDARWPFLPPVRGSLKSSERWLPAGISWLREPPEGFSSPGFKPAGSQRSELFRLPVGTQPDVLKSDSPCNNGTSDNEEPSQSAPETELGGNAKWHGAARPVFAPTIPTRRGTLQAWSAWFESGNSVSAGAGLPLADQEQLQALAEMRSQRRREHLGVYDGVLGARGRELMELRDQTSGGARLSGSDLEFYARCPIRYFFERVLTLRHAERPDDDIDARAAGTLVHEIARQWVMQAREIRQSGDLPAGLALLDEITRGNCEKLPIRPILREAEWRRLMGFDGQSGPLVKWLRLELGGANSAWGAPMRPISHAETSVEILNGEGAGLEHRFAIELGGHKIKGFIDRIDRSEDGAHLAVIDYKTGDIAGLPSWKSGDGGLHFQLAIYALALRELPFDGPPPRLAMAYLSLKRAKIARGIGQDGTLGKGCSGAKSLDDAAFGTWLEDVSARAARIGDLRAAGVFNLSLQAPKDAKCDSCASKSLCGQHAPTQVLRAEAHAGSPFVYLPVLRPWET